MNTLFSFIATGESKTPNAVVMSHDDTVPQLHAERYAPAAQYERVTIAPDEWVYPSFGLIEENGNNIDWNALWNAAHKHLVEQCGVPFEAAKTALEKTANNRIATFVPLTGKITFGVPVEGAAKHKTKPSGFTIAPYAGSPKNMAHMFDKGMVAPVVLQAVFSEATPTEGQIEEARRRIPAKAKIIGSTFVKKPEDVFGLFVSEPFFNSYNLNYAADIRGTAYQETALPLYDVDAALRKVNKRLPYEQCEISRDQASRFHALMGDALRAANLAATGEEQPQGVYNCYTTVEFDSAPLSDDVLRAKNSEYIILAQAAQNATSYRCYQFEFSFHIIKVGKAYAPFNLLPEYLP